MRDSSGRESSILRLSHFDFDNGDRHQEGGDDGHLSSSSSSLYTTSSYSQDGDLVDGGGNEMKEELDDEEDGKRHLIWPLLEKIKFNHCKIDK